jgi:signal peptidase I
LLNDNSKDQHNKKNNNNINNKKPHQENNNNNNEEKKEETTIAAVKSTASDDDNSNTSSNKNIKKYIIIIFIVISAAAIIIVSFLFAIQLTFGIINPLYVVASGSMIPNLNIGDLVIVNHNIHFDKLKLDDIIVFKTPGENDKGEHVTIVHRVVEIIKNNIPLIKRGGGVGEHQDNKEFVVIKTKGDANPYSIPYLDYPIRQENYIGKVVYVIPKVGLIIRAIAPPVNYIISIGVIAIIVLIYYIKKQAKE